MPKGNNKPAVSGKGTLVLRKAAAIIKDTFAHPTSTSTITITPTTTEIRQIDLESIVTQLRTFRRMSGWTPSLARAQADKLAKNNGLSFDELARLIESSPQYGPPVLSELFGDI